MKISKHRHGSLASNIVTTLFKIPAFALGQNSVGADTYPGSPDLNLSNRPVRTRMPGDVAGALPIRRARPNRKQPPGNRCRPRHRCSFRAGSWH